MYDMMSYFLGMGVGLEQSTHLAHTKTATSYHMAFYSQRDKLKFAFCLFSVYLIRFTKEYLFHKIINEILFFASKFLAQLFRSFSSLGFKEEKMSTFATKVANSNY